MTIDRKVLEMMRTSNDQTLWDLSHEKLTMLVFLRHFGCQFCREAMDDLSQRRKKFERNGTQIVLVHMSESKVADDYLKKFNLESVENISDPKCLFYDAFGLTKGSFSQLFGLKNFMRGFALQKKYGNDLGKPLGDSLQMPGVFMLSEGKIIESYVHAHAGDRPDYDKLASCAIPNVK